MGIRFACPNGHKLHVKAFLAGKRGVCPQCGARFVIPPEQASEEPASVEVGAGGPAPLRAEVDAGPASIMISIVEPSRAPLARNVAEPPTVIPQPVAVEENEPAPQREAAALGAGVSPMIGAEPRIPAAHRTPSPVSKYVAHRMRSRRNQTRLAVGLIVAVVVLAIILIAVLRHQGTSASENDLTWLEISTTHNYVAHDRLKTEHFFPFRDTL